MVIVSKNLKIAYIDFKQEKRAWHIREISLSSSRLPQFPRSPLTVFSLSYQLKAPKRLGMAEEEELLDYSEDPMEG